MMPFFANYLTHMIQANCGDTEIVSQTHQQNHYQMCQNDQLLALKTSEAVCKAVFFLLLNLAGINSQPRLFPQPSSIQLKKLTFFVLQISSPGLSSCYCTRAYPGLRETFGLFKLPIYVSNYLLIRSFIWTGSLVFSFWSKSTFMSVNSNKGTIFLVCACIIDHFRCQFPFCKVLSIPQQNNLEIMACEIIQVAGQLCLRPPNLPESAQLLGCFALFTSGLKTDLIFLNSWGVTAWAFQLDSTPSISRKIEPFDYFAIQFIQIKIILSRVLNQIYNGESQGNRE